MSLSYRLIQIWLPILFVLSLVAGCSKSSSPAPTPTTTGCTDDNCVLTGHKWGINSLVVSTDLGDYTYSIAQVEQLQWATFTFKADTSYICDSGDHGTYTFDNATDKMILYDNLLPLNFKIDFPTKSSMTMSGDTIHLHPRTDPGTATTFAINSTLPGLHDNFGVDTAQIHYFVSRFYYNGF